MKKENIKTKLLEELKGYNCLGVKIIRPKQELVILRGIPGSGKSTRAKMLVGDGVIHSTDDLIEATGNYREFFESMINTNNFKRLGEMHHQNFLNIKKSMESGILKVIVDNTNIKANEPKKIVEEALKLGFDENNISIVDVGDGGKTAKELSERNTHGVPLKKIKSMISSHKNVGPLTVKKILEAKDMYKPKNKDRVLYSAVVLDPLDRNELLTLLGKSIPKDWKIIAHHMTIIFGKGIEDKTELGKKVTLTVTHLGKSDLAIAVKVNGYTSTNDTPHITLAVNVNAGGKPFNSNQITNWVKLPREISITGIVTDIKP